MWITLSLLFLGLVQTGCTIRFVQTNEAAPPNPNAAQIETRIRQQITRIDGALQAGNLDQNSAEGLAENDEMFRRMSSNYMNENGGQDLNYSQTTSLNAMLDDNGQAINDAIARREAWIQGFQGGNNYDYGSPGDRYLYISKLHQDLYQQQVAVNTAVQSNRLTQEQAQSMRVQINIVYNTEQSYYRQNGRMDLNKDQMFQLRRMVVANNRLIHHGIYGNQAFNEKNPAWGNGPNDFQRHYSAKPGTVPPPSSGNQGTPARNPGLNTNGAQVSQPAETPVNRVLPNSTAVVTQPVAMATPQPNQPSIGTSGSAAKPVSKLGVQPAAKPAAIATAPGKLVSLDKLKARVKDQDDRILKARMMMKITPADFKKFSDKQKALGQAMNKALSQNHMKGVTPDQLGQLSKMADDIDQMLSPKK